MQVNKPPDVPQDVWDSIETYNQAHLVDLSVPQRRRVVKELQKQIRYSFGIHTED